MPDEIAAALSKTPSGLKLNSVEKVLVGLVTALILCVPMGTFLADRRFSSIEQTQREGKERTYQSRAVSCRLILLHGAKLEKSCLLPEVTAYYDPNEKPTTANSAIQNKNRAVLCATLRADHPAELARIEAQYGRCEDTPKSD